MNELKPYPEYKDSGSKWIGAIPSHWGLHSLRSIITAKNERNRLDLPLLSVVREKGVILRSLTGDDDNHNIIPDDLSNYKVVNTGDFVINKMKAWQGSLGLAPCDGVVSPAYYVFKICFANSKFGHFLLRSKPYVAHFGQVSDGVRIGQWDLSIQGMKQIPAVIPEENEQTAIVRFIDYTDRRIRRFIRAKQRIIKLLEEQKQAIIHRAVTRGLDPSVPLKDSGVPWLGEIPAHWEIISLRMRYSVELGKMLDAKRITGQASVPYLRNRDVQWDKILVDDLPSMDINPDEYPRYTIKYGDLLVCEGGEVGRSAFWNGQLPLCGFQKALHRVRAVDPTHDYPRFLFYVINLAATRGIFTADGNENTFAHLTCEKLRRHRFPFTPYIEQYAIVKHIDGEIKRYDIAITSTERKISLLREYRTRLIADVVTGKLDVRNVAESLPDETDEPIEESEADTLAEDGEMAENDLDSTYEEVEV